MEKFEEYEHMTRFFGFWALFKLKPEVEQHIVQTRKKLFGGYKHVVALHIRGTHFDFEGWTTESALHTMLQCSDAVAAEQNWALSSTLRFVACDRPEAVRTLLRNTERTVTYTEGLVRHVDEELDGHSAWDKAVVYRTVMTELMLIGSADTVLISAGGFARAAVHLTDSQAPLLTLEECKKKVDSQPRQLLT